MAALLAQNNSMVRVASEDVPRNDAVLAQLGALRARGASFEEQAETVPHTRTPGMVAIYYRTYQTNDAAIGIACVSPGIQRTLMRAVGLEDAAHTRTMSRDEQAQHYGPVRVLAPPIRLDGDGFQPGAPTPAFASETRTILRDH